MWGGRPRPPPAPWLACQQADEAFAAVQGAPPTKPMPERLPESSRYPTRRISPDFSSYLAPELAVRSKRQITKGIDNEEAVEWKTVCVAPGQSVCSACFAKRANAARDQRSILARTALSLWFCLRSEEHTSELQSLRHLVC